MLYTCSKLLHAPAWGDKLVACEQPEHEQGLFILKGSQTNINAQRAILSMRKAIIVHCQAQDARQHIGDFWLQVKSK